MKPLLVTTGILFLSARAASAHRLDEYLQATILSIEKDRVQADLRLTPGVAVLPFVLAAIDTNADGLLSQSEQQAYVERVLHDLSMQVDGVRVPLRLVSSKFPGMQELKDGLGEIQIEFTADLPNRKSNRTLVFENHHQSRISAYLVNCLTPADPDIRVSAQKRNYQQSVYQLDYTQTGVRSLFDDATSSEALIVMAALVLLCVRLARPILLRGTRTPRSAFLLRFRIVRPPAVQQKSGVKGR